MERTGKKRRRRRLATVKLRLGEYASVRNRGGRTKVTMMLPEGVTVKVIKAGAHNG